MKLHLVRHRDSLSLQIRKAVIYHGVLMVLPLLLFQLDQKEPTWFYFQVQVLLNVILPLVSFPKLYDYPSPLFLCRVFAGMQEQPL